MKSTVQAWLTLWLGACFVLLPGRVAAQPFGIGVTASPLPLLTNTPFTYLTSVTNLSGGNLNSVFVTNTISSVVNILSASNFFGTATLATANRVIFFVSSLPEGQHVTLAVNAVSGTATTITNLVVARTAFNERTDALLVSEVFSGRADLGVRLIGPTSGALVNDWVTYQLIVTNAGPQAALGVVVSNQLPAEARLISVNPPDFNQSGQRLTFNLVRLANRAAQTYEIRVQPTNAGTLTFTAGVRGSTFVDTNTANNEAAFSVEVGEVLSGNLIATNLTGQSYNPQTGLMEQWIRLVNIGENPAVAARVLVSGLTNRLFNAVGTNDARPFVVYASGLPAGDSVDLLLEYLVPTRQPVPNPGLSAVEIPLPMVTVPTNAPPNITKVLATASGGLLIEFAATPGRRYTVLYSDDPDFSNPRVAQPSFIAPANRVQWIDEGPPKTVSPPVNAASRYYRVVESP